MQQNKGGSMKNMAEHNNRIVQDARFTPNAVMTIETGTIKQ